MGADDALLLGLGEHVHHAAITRGPVGFGGAVDEQDVDVVGAELAAEAIEVIANFLGIAVVGLGEHGDFVARQLLDGRRYIRMAAVGVGGVEEAKSVLVVAVEHHRDEWIGAEARLIRRAAAADGAGAHSETASADAGAAEDDVIVGTVFAGDGGYRKASCTCLTGDPGGGQARSGATKEISAMHRGLLCQTGYSGARCIGCERV